MLEPLFIGFAIGYILIQIMKRIDVFLAYIVFWTMTLYKAVKATVKDWLEGGADKELIMIEIDCKFYYDRHSVHDLVQFAQDFPIDKEYFLRWYVPHGMGLAYIDDPVTVPQLMMKYYSNGMSDFNFRRLGTKFYRPDHAKLINHFRMTTTMEKDLKNGQGYQ